MYRAALCTSFMLLALSFAPFARASEPFPEVIKTQLMLPGEAPLCTLCHQTLIGGLMTITKPFGKTAQKHGLVALDVPGLRRVLMEMQAGGDDSDGDRVGDIAELLQGTDPNVPEGGPPPEEARYGCYCSTVGGLPASSAAGAAWLSGLVLSAWRRRRTAHRRSARET